MCSTVVVLEVNHLLITLCQSIAWEGLMEQAIPILYDEQGISKEAGRYLNSLVMWFHEMAKWIGYWFDHRY